MSFCVATTSSGSSDMLGMDYSQYTDEAVPVQLLQGDAAFHETDPLAFDTLDDLHNSLTYYQPVHISHDALTHTTRQLSTLERWITIESKEDPFSPESTLHHLQTGGKGLANGPVGIDLFAQQNSWTSAAHHQGRASPVATIISSSASKSCSSCYSDGYSNADGIGYYLPCEEYAYFNGYLPQSEANALTSRFDTSGIALQQIQPVPDVEQDLMSTTGTPRDYHPDQSQFVTDSLSFPESIVAYEDFRDQDAEGEPDGSAEYTGYVKEDESDADYKPSMAITPKRTRTARSPKHCSHSSSPRSNIKKCSIHKPTFFNRKHINGLSSALSNENAVRNTTPPTWTAARPFSCPLTPYGCHKTFASKNEWKRHITSQHICLGFWRCDLCLDMDTSPNDFNRKDLFTEHLRRIHSRHFGHKDASRPEADRDITIKPDHDRRLDGKLETLDDALKDAMEDTRTRCWVPVRELPMKMSCVFCGKCFTKNGSFKQWLEHVGHHIAVPAHKPRRSTTKRIDDESGLKHDHIKWEKDEVLREWLLSEGLLEKGKAEGTWTIMGRRTTSNGRLNVCGRMAEDQAYNEQEDAEGEED